jgi:Ca2+-binding EF-hand superfamily protein
VKVINPPTFNKKVLVDPERLGNWKNKTMNKPSSESPRVRSHRSSTGELGNKLSPSSHRNQSESSKSLRSSNSKSKTSSGSYPESDQSQSSYRGRSSTGSNHGSKKGRRFSPERRSNRSSSDRSSPCKKKSNRPATVSAFLRSTHKEFKKKIATIQSHINFIQDLAVMREQKKINLLFDMIDRDGGGTIDAKELASAMRQNDELSFSDSIEKAIDMVATFDVDGNGELDKTEFRDYVFAMVAELGVSPSDFCEFLIVQLLLNEDNPQEQTGEMATDKITEEVKAREQLFAILANGGTKNLFQQLDKDRTGGIPYSDVARRLDNLVQDDTESVQDAMEVLLMTDRSDTRALDYESFGRLIFNTVQTTKRPLEDILSGLKFDVEDHLQNDDEEEKPLFEESEEVKGLSQQSGNANDPLINKRLKKLFYLWDTNGDGDISTDELASGLRVFHDASGITVDADDIAEALIRFDEDGDNQLDQREFSEAMIKYAEQFGTDLHKLIDFMCLTAVQTDMKAKSSALKHRFNSSFRSMPHSISNVPEEKQELFLENEEFDDFWY